MKYLRIGFLVVMLSIISLAVSFTLMYLNMTCAWGLKLVSVKWFIWLGIISFGWTMLNLTLWKSLKVITEAIDKD